VSTEAASPESSPEVRSVDDLEAYFHAGGKPRERWKVGVEYETPAVARAGGEALPYDGAQASIRGVLEDLAAAGDDWEPVYEDNQLIALRHASGASITLEPGGQVEMSGKQCATIHEAQEELSEHTDRLVGIASSRSIAFLGLGISPVTPVERYPWMPKRRYRIMRQIMEASGTLGHRMMLQTATVQGNFDYASEEDARAKLRVSLGLSPILVAISANSPICDGQPTGFKSYRAHIWTDTDRDRCGLIPFAFDTHGIFRAYAEYALDVPMYFVARGGELLAALGMTFREFMTHGFGQHRATEADWSTHLTTLFPEARLKTYVEVRAADGQPQHRIMAVPALLKGVLYDDDCTAAVWDLVGKWPVGVRLEALASASKHGLDARVGRHRVVDLACEIVSIATNGLQRQAKLGPAGHDETIYLEGLRQDVEQGITPADRALAAWRRGPDALIQEFAYR
jgi:glutamate--cysteine ligase